MPDGALVAYYDKPENYFYRLTQTWPNGYPEWRSTIDAIVEEVSAAPASTRGDALFTRCSDDGIREYVESVFDFSPPSHVWDLAEAFNVRPERIRDVEKAIEVTSAAVATQDATEELVALEMQRERHRVLDGLSDSELDAVATRALGG